MRLETAGCRAGRTFAVRREWEGRLGFAEVRDAEVAAISFTVLDDLLLEESLLHARAPLRVGMECGSGGDVCNDDRLTLGDCLSEPVGGCEVPQHFSRGGGC